MRCAIQQIRGGGVTVFAEPLHYKKKFKPLIEHRPGLCNELTTEEICRNFGFQYYKSFHGDILPPESIMLVCGAGIIPEDLIKKYRIINAHPGYIPNVRGLDALKWAIYDGQPIGVTTHLLGEHVDAGQIIDRKIVPLYFNDTFHAVAQRQYEMEVRMLVEAVEKIDHPGEYADPLQYPLRRRMPHELETRVMERFRSMIERIPIEE